MLKYILAGLWACALVLPSCKKDSISSERIIPERRFPPIPRNPDLPFTPAPLLGNICLSSIHQLRPGVEGTEFVINEITLDDGTVIQLNGPERIFSMKLKIYSSSTITSFQIARVSFRCDFVWTFNNNGATYDYPIMNGYDTGIEACNYNSKNPVITFQYRSFLKYRFRATIPYGLHPNRPTSRYIVSFKP